MPPTNGAMAARRNWQLTAWLAGVFSVLVGLTMILGRVSIRAEDPLKSPQLKEYKERLRLNPVDEQIKKHVRELDLRLRQRYFRQLTQMESGVYLLLSGVAVFILAVTQAARCQKQLPMPKPKAHTSDQSLRSAARARWSVAASGAAIGAFLFALSLGLSMPLTKQTAELEKLLGADEATGSGDPLPLSQAKATDAASPQELQRNWPRFRGPDGGGVSILTNVPVSWDTKTGAGVAWKVSKPTSGFSSPIVWGDRLFLSGGDAQKREVVCLDCKSGQVVWRQPVADVTGAPAQPAEVPESTGYAASTMATDGRRVYVLFANGDCAAFTLDGQPLWFKNLGALKNPYGHATSLATWRDRLILQLDQGDAEDNKSKLYALDGRTGQIVWQRPRKVGASWASPIVIEAAGKGQVILLAVPCVTSYAAADGAELWRAECLNGEITPSPVFAGGLLFVASPSEKLLAIRPDGQGDVTKTHVAWSSEDNVPDVTSPLSSGELVFMMTTSGMLTCLDAKDGKKQWDHDYEMEFHASPSLAAGRLYLFGQKGTAVVVEAGRHYKELLRTEMSDAFHASPAFAQDRIFLRGVTNVWCIGATAAKEKAAAQP
ncbi:MAG: PQQ-binding-like beta-propeller repeat protein [Verrucomicrobia bacterium]|nr:PQQ-binding-like beta-propeller repeat protein [Verrucomicrobiota bacterium]